MSDRLSPAQPLSRRAFLGRFAALGGIAVFAGCGGDAEAPTVAVGDGEYPVVEAAACEGYDATVDEQSRTMRTNLNYADASETEGQYCGNCQLKQDYAADASCLGCQLFAGPVSPGGWCMSWVAA